MDFRQITYFLCLVEQGSVTRAARKLNIVQPALSMQISNLEKLVNQRLFERKPHGMVPTEAAKSMYRLLQPVMSDLERAQKSITRLSGDATGRVTVGIVASVAYSVLLAAICRFDTECPNVNLLVEEDHSGGLVERVRSGHLDTALVNIPNDRAGLSVRPLLSEEFVLVLGTRVRTQLPRKVKLASISSLKLVLPSKRNGLRIAIDRGAAAQGVKLSPKFEIDTLTTLVDLVADTDFATLLPPVTVRNHLDMGRVRIHSVIEPKLATTLGWISRSRHPLNPLAKRFIEIFGDDLLSGSA